MNQSQHLRSKYENKISYKLSGRYALFSEIALRTGGEKTTMEVPTYQALKGITESIYWKPAIVWFIDRVKVLRPIVTETKGIRPIKYGGGNDLSYYTYLKDVAYLVEAHFEFNQNRPDLKDDWKEHKHYQIAKRSLQRGGRRDVFLGARECQGYVEPATFDSEEGYYSGIMEFSLRYHSIVYPDESADGQRHIKFWRPKMVDSVIEFCRPEACPVDRLLLGGSIKTFNVGSGYTAVEAEALEVLS